jgi:hypothetical protein
MPDANFPHDWPPPEEYYILELTSGYDVLLNEQEAQGVRFWLNEDEPSATMLVEDIYGSQQLLCFETLCRIRSSSPLIRAKQLIVEAMLKAEVPPEFRD